MSADNWGRPERAPLSEYNTEIWCLSWTIDLQPALDILHIYRTSCCKSLPALILRVLASFVTSKTSEKTQTIDGNSKDGDHLWTYLFMARAIGATA